MINTYPVLNIFKVRHITCHTFIYIYRPQRSNVFTPVCQSFCSQGVGVSASGPVGMSATPPADTPLGRHPPGQTLPARCMLGDTVNKWAVRILLECILKANTKKTQIVSFVISDVQSPKINSCQSINEIYRIICLTSVTRVKCGIRSALCWKIANISGSTDIFGL